MANHNESYWCVGLILAIPICLLYIFVRDLDVFQPKQNYTTLTSEQKKAMCLQYEYINEGYGIDYVIDQCEEGR